MPEPRPAEPPLPPVKLMSWVGHKPDENIEFTYLVVGQILKSSVLDLLGSDWSWEGRRMLDFGCGSGRLLRQFLDEAHVGEFHGSDISEEMVAWDRQHLCPPIAGIAVNGRRPPLDYPDDHFDVVTAMSVFTHIADGWSDWLLELRRILKPDGTLIATFLDSSFASFMAAAPWDEERVGMSAFGFADPIDLPNVLHSHWWLREHWGRAFEVLELRPGAEGPAFGEISHGMVALRPRDVELSAADVERESPGDDRYLEARKYQYELLRAEGEELRRRHDQLLNSSSWRLTSPLRRAKAAALSARARLKRNGRA